MKVTFFHAATLSLLIAPIYAEWPQAAGPEGNWQIHGPEAPVQWSVVRNQNIVWRSALPNGEYGSA